jgi:hypothetical protein
MDEQRWIPGNRDEDSDLGGSMRLGAQECMITNKTLAKRFIRKVRYSKGTDIDMSLILISKGSGERRFNFFRSFERWFS